MNHTSSRDIRGALTVLALIVAFSLAAIGLPGCATTGQPEGRSAGLPETVVRKSPNDHKSYRYLVLDNALRVLLVSDPDAERAAASLSVLRGSYHEGVEHPGLAHFLEHMLFIGTEKYPEVDGYQQFISAHGGGSNAYTASEHTNYFFEIEPGAFPEAMDRFAQFFISPLFDPAYVEREKNAVHSEYQMQIRTDGWRSAAVIKSIMIPDHPGSRFDIGSLETLGDGVQQALVDFFESSYSADQMVLVALSPEPVEEMARWIPPLFRAIENREIGPAPGPGPAYPETSLPARLTYQSLSDRHRLVFNFPIPSLDPHYRSKPAQYLTNLLGHEGEGSLHQLLTARGLIESLAAGVSRLDADNAFLNIDMELTAAGRGRTEEITSALFGYIELLESRDPEAWRYHEQASAAELSFRFQEQSSPTGFVYRTSPNLALYPPEDVLIADYLMEGFDPSLIGHYLSYLRPDNVLVERSGPDVATDSVEPWFDVAYRLETELEDLPPADPAGMHLPAANPFLPDDLDLIAAGTRPPELVVEAPGAELWLAEDVEFRVPRANQVFHLGVEGGLATPTDAALAHLYRRLASDALNRYTYPAMLAGLSYQLGVTGSGFQVSVFGFSDKQHMLLERILSGFANLEIDETRFNLFREELVRDWRNFRFERPYTQAYTALGHLVLEPSFDPETLADAAGALTVADIRRWQASRLGHIKVVGLAHGNLRRDDVAAAQRLLDAHLPLTDFELARPRVVVIDQALSREVPVDHDDAAMVLYVQDREATYASRARSALTAELLEQAYFSELRTEQQLGYIVAMATRRYRDRGGIAFVIQSPVASAAALEEATLAFMEARIPWLEGLADDQFEQYKASLVSRLTERARNLQERTGRYLADLDHDVLTFDSQERIAAIVAGLTLEEMTAHLIETVARMRTARVLVYSMGRFDEAPLASGTAPAGMAAARR